MKLGSAHEIFDQEISWAGPAYELTSQAKPAASWAWSAAQRRRSPSRPGEDWSAPSVGQTFVWPRQGKMARSQIPKNDQDWLTVIDFWPVLNRSGVNPQNGPKPA